MTPAETKRLLLGVHKVIEDTADALARQVTQGMPPSPMYPPDGGLTDAERHALQSFPSDPSLYSGLRKLFADAAATVVFRLFNYIDGTGDPPGEEYGGTYRISPTDGCVPFLHDLFYPTYWDRRQARGDKGWHLDTLDDAEGY